MSPSYSALDAVSAAVYSTLNVAALLAVAPGGVSDQVPQNATFPRVLYEVSELVIGGLGSRPGAGQRLLEIDLRVHAFSTYAGMLECQRVLAVALELLATAPSVTGYGSWAIFHDDTVPLPDQMVAGKRVNELVANCRLYVSEAA